MSGSLGSVWMTVRIGSATQLRSLRSEWLKLRTTRTIFWLLLAMFAVMTLFVVAGVLSNHKDSLAKASNQLDFLNVGFVALVIALVMGLIVSTGEFRHGTVTPTLLATPSRISVVISKAIAGLLFGATLVALAEVVVIGELAIMLPLKGVGFAIHLGAAASLLGRILFDAALWGAIGSGLGLAVRNQIGAFVGSFVWLFFLESLIAGILSIHAIGSHAGRFFPLRSTIAVLRNGGGEPGIWLSRGAAMITVGGWAVLATLVALFFFTRRDVS